MKTSSWPKATKPEKPPIPRWKWVLFRCLAISLSLLPLIVFELAARGAGWGVIDEQTDPFVGFESVSALFKFNDETGLMEVDERRYPYFRPESFALEKPADEYRIFCLGGSTVQGRPYAIETSFTSWLEIGLNTADPSKKWNAVNCGGVSYASYRLAPILDEVLQYEPDLIVLYTGHNEFLEDRSYGKIKRLPAWQKSVHRNLSGLRTYNLLRRYLASDGSTIVKNKLPAEVDARLDYENGLADYHRDEIWKQGVIEHFAQNLERMVNAAQRAGVPVILVNPVVNLVDQPPFKSLHREDLTEASSKLFAQRFQEGTEATDPQTSLDALNKAAEIDSEYAAVHFAMGHAQLALNNIDSAAAAFIKAKELDICPLRIVEPMRQAIFQLGRESGTPVIDLQSIFDRKSPHKIAGKEALVDHVHPSVGSHQKIARILMAELAELGFANIDDSADAAWHRENVMNDFANICHPLTHFILKTGRLRLEGLIRWTQGKSRKKKQAREKDL